MIATPWSSLRFRLIAAAVAGLGLGLIAAGAVLLSVYTDNITRAFDVRLEALARILVANADVDTDGKLGLRSDIGEPLFETAYSGWYWQISTAPSKDHPAAVLSRSRSLFDAALDVGGPDAPRRDYATGPRRERLRIVRLRVTLPNAATPYVVAVAGDYDEVRAQIDAYIVTLAIALMLLAVGACVAVWLQVRFALSPLRRVRGALANVRGGVTEKLEGHFPSEVEPLVTELNALLAHNKAVLERARTQVGNLAHALKTPLSVLRGELDGKGDQLRDVVRRETETMRRQVDHYLARARAAAAANVLGARTPVLPRASALVRTMDKIHSGRSIEFGLDCPAGVAFRGEAEDLDEILGNLLDNGGKWAHATVQLKVEPVGGTKLRIVVDDDGPGLDEEEREAVLVRGERLDESVPGSGLGLSIVRDLVSLYGGDLTLEPSDLGGLRVSAVLPAVGG
jgi:signal transduction histidine kinase